MHLCAVLVVVFMSLSSAAAIGYLSSFSRNRNVVSFFLVAYRKRRAARSLDTSGFVRVIAYSIVILPLYMVRFRNQFLLMHTVRQALAALSNKPVIS